MTQSTITPTSPAPVAARNGFGVTALVLGIVGAVFSWVPVFGFILAVLAVVFGALGYARTRKGEANNPGMAIAGLVLGIIAFVVQVIVFAAVGSAANQASKDLQGITGHDPAALSDVAVSDCSISSEYGTALSHATVKITNSTPKAQSYMATIGVNSPDGSRLGEINVVSNSLGAGQSVVLSGMNASGTVTPGTKPGLTACVVANVNRIPS